MSKEENRYYSISALVTAPRQSVKSEGEEQRWLSRWLKRLRQEVMRVEVKKEGGSVGGHLAAVITGPRGEGWEGEEMNVTANSEGAEVGGGAMAQTRQQGR